MISLVPGNLPWLFDMSKHMVCILHTELVKSVLRLHITRIQEGRSRNLSTFFSISRHDREAKMSRVFSTFPILPSNRKWKFLDFFSIFPFVG